MTLVVAHRGASAAHPPGNTLAAFAASVALGADWVELDVHLSADGIPVVHHDPDLADGRGLGDLRRADLPGFVPSLAESIDTCGSLGVNVEIKPDGPERLRGALIESVVDLLVALGRPERFLVTSFDHSIVARVRTLAPEVPTGLLTFEVAELVGLVDRAVDEGHAAVVPWWGMVDESFVDRTHARGVAVNVWTVDDPDDIGRLVAMGVDAVITNVPDIGRAVVSGG
ncbi:MAG: glycerophosphodiester phosphodiesterase [Acidimicrobiia bacterium]